MQYLGEHPNEHGYGARGHNGIDLRIGQQGKSDPVTAPEAWEGAQVTYAGKDPWLGNKVRLRLKNGAIVDLGHFASLNVKAGQKLRAGQKIGMEGMTGNADGYHLHVGLYDPKGQPVYDWQKYQDLINPLNPASSMRRGESRVVVEVRGLDNITVNGHKNEKVRLGAALMIEGITENWRGS